MRHAGNRFLALALIAFAASACTKRVSQRDLLHVDRNFLFPRGFPADPGEAGKRTLEGIDSDRDGLRDDVQRWIFARYPNDVSKRNSLRQMALAIQMDSTTDLSQEQMRHSLEQDKRAIACLYYSFP